MKQSGWLARRLAAKSLAARSPVDVALFGVGVATAAASVVFAATMFGRGDHAPFVNGMQYLGVFGRPNGAVAAAPPASVAPAPAATAVAATDKPARSEGRQSIDMSPTGAIARSEADPPPELGPYRLVAVELGMAWLRNAVETRVVKPGDFAPGLGRVAAIVMRDGRWTLLDESGAVLLAADPADAAVAAVNPFSRRMIFGGQ